LRRLFGKYLGIETAAVPVWPARRRSLAATRPLTLARIDPGTPLSFCKTDIGQRIFRRHWAIKILTLFYTPGLGIVV